MREFEEHSKVLKAMTHASKDADQQKVRIVVLVKIKAQTAMPKAWRDISSCVSYDWSIAVSRKSKARETAMSARYYYFMSMTTVDFVVLFCLLSVIIKIGRPATTRHHLSDLVHSIARSDRWCRVVGICFGHHVIQM